VKLGEAYILVALLCGATEVLPLRGTPGFSNIHALTRSARIKKLAGKKLGGTRQSYCLRPCFFL
jgi:hypothetical protein